MKATWEKISDFATNTVAPAARAAGRVALDAVLPPQCLSCRAPVVEPGRLCAACWSEVEFLDGPSCATCGMPFETAELDGAMCGACTRDTPTFDKARAVMRYDDASKGMILGLKHADRHEGAKTYGQWLARSGADFLDQADLICAVPLHRRRLLSRRYNQAALIAQALSVETQIPSDPMVLERVRATPSQGGLNKRQRRHNVSGAFRIRPGWEERIKDRRVVLVDDVLTTGATVEACARTLKRGGVSGIYVLSLARVVRPL